MAPKIGRHFFAGLDHLSAYTGRSSPTIAVLETAFLISPRDLPFALFRSGGYHRNQRDIPLLLNLIYYTHTHTRGSEIPARKNVLRASPLAPASPPRQGRPNLRSSRHVPSAEAEVGTQSTQGGTRGVLWSTLLGERTVVAARYFTHLLRYTMQR